MILQNNSGDLRIRWITSIIILCKQKRIVCFVGSMPESIRYTEKLIVQCETMYNEM